MKPQAIRQFDFLYLGGYAVAIIGSFLGLGAAQRAMAAIGAANSGSSFIYGGIIFSIVIALLLWFFISVRHSNVAKWIAAVLVLLGLLSELRSLTTVAPVINGVSFAPDRTALIVGLVGIILEAVGISRLFTPEGRAWLGQTAVAAPTGPNAWVVPDGNTPVNPRPGFPPEPPYPPQR